MTTFAGEQRLVAAGNRERAASITVLTSVIAVLIALFIAWRTSSLIARPIVALAAVMRRLAGGHLEDEIVGLQRGDELGSMTRAVKVFQDNAIRVRALEAEAEAERQCVLAELENMVAERTRELQQANTMLREEIIKHTRAEEEIRRLNEELEQKVEERTGQIRRLNVELLEKIAQLKEAQEDLVRKEKLAILGQLSGIVGHELRNPLGVMSTAVYFLKMVHAEADETTKVKGIGLGLVACKNLVEANNGRIDVASRVGEGTTFTLTLPVQGDET